MKWDVKRCHFGVILIFLLTSCAYNPFSSNNHLTGSATGAVVGAGVGAGIAAGTATALNASSGTIWGVGTIGAITGGALGYYLTTLRHDAGAIIRAGGEVYREGDYLGIYIPSDQLFEPNTTEFTPVAPTILDSAITVLERRPENNILISGNTSGFASAKWEHKLSEARARQVAGYFWSNGLKNFQGTDNFTMRKLNYVGYGNYFPIANNWHNDSIRENSSIQITSYPSKAQLKGTQCDIAMNNIGAYP